MNENPQQNSIQRSSRYITRFVAIAFVVSFGLFGGLFIAGDPEVQEELLIEMAKALLQVGVFGVLAAFAKYLLDEHQRAVAKQESDSQARAADLETRRLDQERKHRALLDLLNHITSLYWQVKKALHLILAYKSAAAYRDQVLLIMDARLQLQRLDNEVVNGVYDLDDPKTVADSLHKMHNELLRAVVDEWRQEHLRLARLQVTDEKSETKLVPAEIEKLPELTAIRSNEFEVLHMQFEAAVKPIREQLGYKHLIEKIGKE